MLLLLKRLLLSLNAKVFVFVAAKLARCWGLKLDGKRDRLFPAIPSSDERSTAISPDQLYSADTVECINGGLHRGQLGEMAYALAWVDTQANITRRAAGYGALPDPQTTLSMIA